MVKLTMFPKPDDNGKKATLINKAMVSSVDIRERWFRSSTDTEENVKMLQDVRGKLIGYEAIVHMAGGETLYIEKPQLDTVITELRQLLDVVILRPFEVNFLQGPEIHAQWCDKCQHHHPEQDKHHTNSEECRMCFTACNFRKVEKTET